MATEEIVDDDPAEDMPDPDLEVIEDDLVEEVLEVDDDDSDEAEATDGEEEAFDEQTRQRKRAEAAGAGRGIFCHIVDADTANRQKPQCFRKHRTPNTERRSDRA